MRLLFLIQSILSKVKGSENLSLAVLLVAGVFFGMEVLPEISRCIHAILGLP